MLHLLALAALDIDPQQRPFIETRRALLIKVSLAVMTVGIIQERVDHPALAVCDSSEQTRS
jgi:hypothetical protein